MAVNNPAGGDVEAAGGATTTPPGRSPLSHSMKRLAVSLVALLAMLALFATLSAAAQGVAETGRPIIDPAIDETA